MKLCSRFVFVLASLSVCLCSACNSDKKPESSASQALPATPTPTAPAAPPSAPEAAAQIFRSRCTVCHGDSGKGDGAAAAALQVKPRNYTDAAWQKSVTDEQITNIIVKGGAAVGKDPGMPGNPDLEAKPEVVLELVKRVRAFAPSGQ